MLKTASASIFTLALAVPFLPLTRSSAPASFTIPRNPRTPTRRLFSKASPSKMKQPRSSREPASTPTPCKWRQQRLTPTAQ